MENHQALLVQKFSFSETKNLTKEKNNFLLTNCEDITKKLNIFFLANAVKRFNIQNHENCDCLAENIDDPTLNVTGEAIQVSQQQDQNIKIEHTVLSILYLKKTF